MDKKSDRSTEQAILMQAHYRGELACPDPDDGCWGCALRIAEAALRAAEATLRGCKPDWHLPHHMCSGCGKCSCNHTGRGEC